MNVPFLVGTPFLASESERPLCRTAYQLEWVALFLIGLDFPIHIIQPPKLREMLRTLAAKALQIASDEH